MEHLAADPPPPVGEGEDLTKLKKAIEAHLSVTITGSNTFQLGEEQQTYSLTATLHYHGSDELASPSTAPAPLVVLPPLTIKQAWSPVSKFASLTGLYCLHPISPPDAPALEIYRAKFELIDEPKAVNAENGFTCLHPNESVTREVVLMPACFPGAKPDTRYKIKMAPDRGRIQWWGVGEMERFRDVKVRCTELSLHGGLAVRSSNEIEVLAVERSGVMGL